MAALGVWTGFQVRGEESATGDPCSLPVPPTQGLRDQVPCSRRCGIRNTGDEVRGLLGSRNSPSVDTLSHMRNSRLR